MFVGLFAALGGAMIIASWSSLRLFARLRRWRLVALVLAYLGVFFPAYVLLLLLWLRIAPGETGDSDDFGGGMLALLGMTTSVPLAIGANLVWLLRRALRETRR
jgi:hypothetical protein